MHQATIERKQRAWELQLLEERKLRERSSSRSAGPVSSSLREEDNEEGGTSRDKSHGREKREVEKTVVSAEPEGNKHSLILIARMNHVRVPFFAMSSSLIKRQSLVDRIIILWFTLECRVDLLNLH